MPLDRPPHRGLRHLALNVRDLEGMKRFYRDLLGFAVEWEPDPDNVYMTSGVDNLALHRSTSSTAPAEALTPNAAKGSAQTLDHLGVIVRDMDDVDRWGAFLESRGVTLAAKPKTHRDGARSLYFNDPDGNTVQVIYHPPISGRI